MEHTLAITVSALLLVFALVFSAFALNGSFSSGKEEAAKLQSDIPVGKTEIEMKLGAYQGHLALFIGDGRYPNEVYETLLRSLPEEDRKRISEGIPVSSEAELSRLLEDLTS